MKDFELYLRRRISGACTQAAVSKLLGVEEKQIGFVNGDEIYKVFLPETFHAQSVCLLLTDYGSRSEFTFGLTIYGTPSSDLIPVTDERYQALAIGFARELEQDVLIGDYTADSPYQWLLIGPDGRILTVSEDAEAWDEDSEEDILRLDMETARPFEPDKVTA